MPLKCHPLGRTEFVRPSVPLVPPQDGDMSMEKEWLKGNDDSLHLAQQAIDTPSANGDEEVVGIFICEAQFQQLPPLLVVGFIVIVDFVNQCFHKLFQQPLVLQYLFYSFLIHRFCAKVASLVETSKAISKSQDNPGLFNKLETHIY